ncbi:right handed beta helix region containing protein [Alphaentomopoxvirus acuprea]|uniref:Right handed beta helix region containing protein n=1 Tax=Alphaentomopoxvirus acuprea TaxID=62099 RepID=W6JL68_9POXV|nr:right handed beta helix region containing protein [Anomala cuprea entomopoxvirus]BAO49595.1 right handed beta helix region containing protein [Anomala cuprea entomopoxvirus]
MIILILILFFYIYIMYNSNKQIIYRKYPITNYYLLKLHFNAIGDGNADDTDSFYKFIKILSNNGGTGIIENGNYKIKLLKINCKKKIIIQGENKYDTCLIKNTNGNFITVLESDHIEIKNITLKCEYSSKKYKGHGICIVRSNNCVIDNCNVYDYLGSGIIAYTNSTSIYKNIIIKNCYSNSKFAYMEYNNIYDKISNKRHLQCIGIIIADYYYSTIDNCRSEYNNFYGLELKQNGKYNRIINCYARYCAIGIGLGSSDCKSNDYASIYNNYIKNCDIGIVIGKCNFIHISNINIIYTTRLQNYNPIKIENGNNSNIENINIILYGKSSSVPLRIIGNANNNCINISNIYNNGVSFKILLDDETQNNIIKISHTEVSIDNIIINNIKNQLYINI